MLLPALAVALANEPLPDTQGDFLVPSRTDAPTNGVLLFDANFEVVADVVETPTAPVSIPTNMLLSEVWGNGSVVAVPPPGWEAGGSYVVEVAPQTDVTESTTASIAFTVADGPADPPSDPVVTSATMGAWSAEEEEHAWGCCAYTRRVTFEVETTSDDPWAYVELTGLFEGDGQIASTPMLHRLDIGIGPGTHTLTYLQWEDDGVLQPPAFEIAHVSAGGVRGDAQRFDLADAEPPPEEEEGPVPAPDACGCGTPGPMTLAPVALAALLARRRRAP